MSSSNPTAPTPKPENYPAPPLRLRILAWLEGISSLILFLVAMPLKYGFDYPALIRPVGMAHGLLFVAFGFALFQYTLENRRPWLHFLLGLVLSTVPFGAFWYDKRYLTVNA